MSVAGHRPAILTCFERPMLKIIQEGQSRIDLERAAIVLVDGNNQGMNILVQVLGGFGARTLHRCGTAAAAQEAFKQNEIDLMVIDAALPDMDG